MNILWLTWKNLWLHPLKAAFNLILVAIAVSLVVILMLVNVQFGQHLGKTSEDIDAILAAKGSPLQSVLCNIFHLDAPTGNVRLGDIRPFLRPVHPLIGRACPLALGDSYRNARIVGTTRTYFDWMGLGLSEGRMYEGDFEAVVGHDLSRTQNIKVGDTLVSDHGLSAQDVAGSHEHGLRVVGILARKGSVADKLVFTTISTYWREHGHHEEDTAHEDHQDLAILDNGDLEHADDEQAVTSVLVHFKGRNIQSLNFVRNVNEGSKVMAVSPAIEISRLYELTNTASELLYWIAVIIGLLSLLAIFINLVQALEERRPELAILRIGGARPGFLFSLLVAEGLMISVLGTAAGFLMAHGLLEWFSRMFGLGTDYGIRGLVFTASEAPVLAAAALSGMIAAWIPAFKAYRQDIAGLMR